MAARRALKVTGTGDRLTEPGYVAEFSAVANIAVGDETPWGIAAALTRLLPGTESGRYTDESADPAAEAVAAAGSGASSPSSATNTATPGWVRRWTPC